MIGHVSWNPLMYTPGARAGRSSSGTPRTPRYPLDNARAVSALGAYAGVHRASTIPHSSAGNRCSGGTMILCSGMSYSPTLAGVEDFGGEGQDDLVVCRLLHHLATRQTD